MRLLHSSAALTSSIDMAVAPIHANNFCKQLTRGSFIFSAGYVLQLETVQNYSQKIHTTSKILSAYLTGVAANKINSLKETTGLEQTLSPLLVCVHQPSSLLASLLLLLHKNMLQNSCNIFWQVTRGRGAKAPPLTADMRTVNTFFRYHYTVLMIYCLVNKLKCNKNNDCMVLALLYNIYLQIQLYM